MRAFHQAIVDELTKHCNSMGQVSSTYADVATAIGAKDYEVHDAIIALKDDGFFPGTPHLTNDFFIVRLEGADADFREQVIKALRPLENANGEVNSTYADIAAAIGGDTSPGAVQEMLLHLKDDGYFQGRPYFTNDQFQVRLPEAS